MKIYYDPKLKEHTKSLRRNATYAERLFWKHLKSRQLHGLKFTRQKPIGNYIVDFYCSKLQLVIEIDGITHDGKQEYDEKREGILRKLGLEVMRFDGYYIINNTNDALQAISDKIINIGRDTTP